MELSLMTFPTQMDIRRKQVTFQDICTAVRENGLKYVDLMKSEVDCAGAAETKKILTQNGLQVACLITNIPMGKINDKKVSARVREVLEMAQVLEAGMLMVIPMGMLENMIKPKRDKKKLADAYVHNLRLAVAMAKGYGVTLCIEDTPSCRLPLSSIEECRYLLESVEGLKLVWDTANRIPGGDTPEAFYKALKPYICHVHLKDVRYVEKSGDACADGRFIETCLWGEGVVPVKELAAMLKEDGYRGICAIEYTKPRLHTPSGHKEHISQFLSLL